MANAHVLYRFYSATGQLLYVGITMNPPKRFKNHRDTKEWWGMVSGITVETYQSREELAQAERRAIKVERPAYNIIHSHKPKQRTDVDAATTCGWFKPIWYGEAREAGRTRRLLLAAGTNPVPGQPVGTDGRVSATWAPRPDNWIETVDKFLSKGLSKTEIAAAVRSTMQSDLPADELWESFCGKCWRSIRLVEVSR